MRTKNAMLDIIEYLMTYSRSLAYLLTSALPIKE